MGDSPLTAYFLVGSTATGKTDVAHAIARAEGWRILSADSMLVYAGMDVGTAKPDRQSRSEVRYDGMDLIGPGERFSAGLYRRVALGVLERNRADGCPTIVVGGTGLYIKSLTHGLTPGQWNERPAVGGPLVGLWVEPGALRRRIAARVDAMFARGLLDEVKALLADGSLSMTSSQAIGYAEAIACLDGQCTEAEARERIVRRTCQLAKRQRTWFRHQSPAEWVDATDRSAEDAAKCVVETWRQHGPTGIACD
jgi:tRNA A37 N6-isopentenylltransferase MiaA